VTGPLYRLTKACISHRWAVLAVWVVLVAGVGFLALRAGTDTSDDLTLPGTDSQAATNLLDAQFPTQANGSNPVVMKAPSGRLTTPRNKRAIRRTVARLERDRQVRRAVSPLSRAGSSALAKNERIGYIAVTLRPGPSELTESEAEGIIARAAPAAKAGLEVATGGYLGQQVSKPSTHLSEAIGIAAAVIVLLFAFGTVVAMGLPIVTALLGLISGLSMVALLGHVAEVPTVAPTLGTMIGLGVGIDYALFIVTRHREQLAERMPVRESIARAGATAGGAVTFAGGTVIVALGSLALARIPLVTTLGVTAALVVLVAIAGALTLLPALLAFAGGGIERLRLPRTHHARDATPHGWRRWARFIAAHPWPVLVVSILVLAALSVPILSLRLGQQDYGAFPTTTESRRAYDLMTEGFGVGSNGPMLIATRLDRPARGNARKLDRLNRQTRREKRKQEARAERKQERASASLEAQGIPPEEAESQAREQAKADRAADADKQRRQARDLEKQRHYLKSPASDPRLVRLRRDLQRPRQVDSVTPPLVKRDGSAAVYTLTPTTAPSALATEALVDRLRSDVIPRAVGGEGMEAYVGGRTPGFIDLATEISSKLPGVILTVIGLSFVLLLLAFRSVFIPLKAGVMNLLSIGAALGVVTAVFERGIGMAIVGLDTTVPVVSFVPLLMFAILFGLSMDYEVFLMTRMKERYARTHDNHEAVVDGLAVTGRVITSAALIMVSVFASFILNGDPTVKQFGVGLAVAIAVDATIVRCMLVPVLMTLLGRGNWWMPRWLDRVTPRVSIEGAEYFEAAARR